MNAFEFNINDGDQVEIIAAEELTEAMKFFQGRIDYWDDITSITTKLIPVENWDTIKIRNTEYDKENKNDQEYYTLTEMMQNVNSPELISTTED